MPVIRLSELRSAARRVEAQWAALQGQFRALETARDDAADAVSIARDAIIQGEFESRVDEQSIAVLRDFGAPVDPLLEAGLSTIADARTRTSAALQEIRGIGPAKCFAIQHAMWALTRSASDSIRVLPDPDGSRKGDELLLKSLDRYSALQRDVVPNFNERVIWRDELSPHVEALVADVRRAGILRGRRQRGAMFQRAEQLEWALAAGVEALDALRSRIAGGAGSLATVWERYQRNNAPFVATLERFGGNRVAPPPEPKPPAGVFWVPGSKQRHGLPRTPGIDETTDSQGPTNLPHLRGGLPENIADAIERFDLERGPMTSLLRRYQEFGARYIAHQERTLIGDDMGLGKTIQVLAAMCHLHAIGKTHFFVVVPKSVLLNWDREVRTHTRLRSFVLNGDQRERLIREWGRVGGVAITTYGMLRSLLPTIGRVDMLAVDEAHMVKNVAMKRSQAVAVLTARSDVVTFLTGTALENRVEELHALVTTVQPSLGPDVADLRSRDLPDPEVVRVRLAPAYLRRTREDVLTELPECTSLEELLELSHADRLAYDGADNNVQAKRRAAVIGAGADVSTKFERLSELLENYRAEHRKVVVFSYFRDVLDGISLVSGGCDQINGSVDANTRQAIIDRFTDTPDFAVLAAQIEAGGIGINLQAAEVVIIMEPQFKPASEAQAIGRVHRQGQARRVVVHRLLAKDTIEDRLVEILKRKGLVFDMYANPSAIKEASDMAVDGSTLDEEFK